MRIFLFSVLKALSRNINFHYMATLHGGNPCKISTKSKGLFGYHTLSVAVRLEFAKIREVVINRAIDSQAGSTLELWTRQCKWITRGPL